MSEITDQEWLFHLHESQHLVWTLSLEMTFSPKCCHGPLWPPQQQKGSKGLRGPMGHAISLPYGRLVGTLNTACRYSTPTPGTDVEGVASSCPSTQQLGHLLTPGGKAVHMGAASVYAQISSFTPRMISEHPSNARAQTQQ